MDQKSRLWIGLFDGGLDRMDTKTGLFTHYTHNPSDTNSISNNNVVFIFENEPNDLWTGNWNNGGINRLNVQTGHFKHYLSQNNITSILKDADSTIWAGSQNGVYRYDTKADEFYQMNEENTGLNITNVVSWLQMIKIIFGLVVFREFISLTQRKKRASFMEKKVACHRNLLRLVRIKCGMANYFLVPLAAITHFIPANLRIVHSSQKFSLLIFGSTTRR
jgi:hypothetical protein